MIWGKMAKMSVKIDPDADEDELPKCGDVL